MQASDFVPTYEEIAKTIGEEQTIKLYKNFRGQQITFPRRIYSIEYVSRYVRDNYDGSNVRELARKFDYSERRIREFIKQNK